MMLMRTARASTPATWGWRVGNTLQLVYTIAWTAGCITLALLVLLLTFGNRRIPLRMAARLWAPGLLRGAGAKLQVEGLERVDFSRPHVFVANHQSMIDICALFRALPVPVRFVIKQELAKVPFVGWYARAMGMVFIERGHAREAAMRLHGVVSIVRAGASLCAFPEGTRSRDGSVGAFKGGAFQVALQAGVPVVPIAIAGSGAVLPASGFKVRPGTITLRIGEPISTAGLHAGDRHALAKAAHDAVAAMNAAAG
ncbi:MAG: 1-acyl-sn-glycerol-3-phosphate acyltransferase [Xanthomonadales bacterium]|nr:1-acyl-sn-glycerol-3-phosphate acyltransferase [Xanthomonadales bacterium]ODU93527.1 MAG: acyltransferase [Rhodanobacter sp. SCN 66-43]OJY86624.1 MAG: 1-acyl-sn-glycerol-3-phosphate acyltransferase [Xanthomonadales bacterium 66-474]